MCMCSCTHSYVADGTSKVPDHEALVIAEVPVELQLRLAGQLRERERERGERMEKGQRGPQI